MTGQRFSRRRFVGAAGALAIGAAFLPAARGLVSPAQQSAAGTTATSAPLALDLAAFTALRGQRFSTSDSSGAGIMDLKLESVTEWSPHGSPGATDAHTASLMGGEYFRLTFSGPAGPTLGQDTYQFQHDAAGSFPLFIVPGAQSGNQQKYAAVIGRLPA
jgi:hypothetical protein